MKGWQFLDAFAKLPVIRKPLIFIVTSSIDQTNRDLAMGNNIVSEFPVKPLSENRLKKLFKNMISNNH